MHNKDYEDIMTELAIYRYLNNAKIPVSYLGFHYLVTAIELTINDISILSCTTKRLYPEIATIHNTESIYAEKNISRLIYHLWNDKKSNYLKEKYPESPPTNAEFIMNITLDVKSFIEMEKIFLF